MPDVRKVPMLLELMFGEAAAGSMPYYSERLLKWAGAFDEWLKLYKGEASPARIPALSWKQMLDLVHKPPWEMTRADVERYRDWLEARGAAKSSIIAQISNLSSFYRWCSRHAVDPEGGGGENYNPTTGIRKPEVKEYAKTVVLNPEEAGALLDIFKRDKNLLSQRDYAFFLSRLRLGVPFGKLQRLQWGQIDVREDGAWVDWRAGRPASRLPDEVWQALLAYLEACGRLGGTPPRSIPPEAYIFTPLVKPVIPGTPDKAENWNEGRCLSFRTLFRALKIYGAQVGIASEKLNFTVLRMTAAMTHLHADSPQVEMQAFLGSKRDVVVEKFRRALRDLHNRPAQAGFEPKTPETLRERSNPFKSEDFFKHGAFAPSQPAEEMEAIRREHISGLAEETAGLVLIMENMERVMDQTPNGGPAAALLDMYSRLSVRLVELSQYQEQNGGLSIGDAWAVEYITHQAEVQNRPIPSVEEMFEWVDADDPTPPDERRPASDAVLSNRLVLRRFKQMAIEEQDPAQLAYLANRYSRGCFRLMRLLKEQGGQENRLEMWLLAILNAAHAKKMEEWGVESPGPWLTPLKKRRRR